MRPFGLAGALTLVGCLVGAVTAVPVVGATPNLIKNGSFEAPNVGTGYIAYATGGRFLRWSVVGAVGNVAVVSGTFVQNGFSFPAKGGAQFLDLTGTSNTHTGVAQVVTTVKGADYSLTFHIGNVHDPAGIFGASTTIKVFVNGRRICTARTTAGGTTQRWVLKTCSFTAASTSTTVKFLNADPVADTLSSLDSVRLVRTN